MKEDFVEGDRATKIKLIVLLAIFIAVVLVTVPLFGKYELSGVSGDVEELQHTVNLLVIFLPAEVFILISCAFLALSLSRRVKKSGSWPPPGMRAAFKTKIRRGGHADFMWLIMILASLIFFIEIYIKIYEWLIIYKVYAVMKMLNL
ncbi:MAG TPA: hypothetical protein ENH40_00950 [Nitrospirae bacterium]|nr:hypothetical protein [Nitrospirota bacterium]